MINIKKHSVLLTLLLMTGLSLLGCTVKADYKDVDETEPSKVNEATSIIIHEEETSEIGAMNSDLLEMTFDDAKKLLETNDVEKLTSYLMHQQVEYYDHLYQLTHEVTVYPIKSQEESSALYVVKEDDMFNLYIDEYNGDLADDTYASSYVIKHGPDILVSSLPEQVTTIEELIDILDMNSNQYTVFINKQENINRKVFLFNDGLKGLAFFLDGDLVKNRLFDLSYNQVDLSILFWDEFYSETAKNFDYNTFRDETMTTVRNYFSIQEELYNIHPIDMGDYYLVLLNSAFQVKITKEYEVFYIDNNYQIDSYLETPLTEVEALKAVREFIKASPLKENNLELTETLFEYEFDTQNKEFFIFEFSDSDEKVVYIKYNAYSDVVDSVWFTIK